MSADLKTSLSQVKRGPKRAQYDQQTAYEIIDAALLCHVAQQKQDQTFIVPTCHWRDGQYLYWHGHAKARNVHDASQAQQKVCINICLLDGLVMARSAFHHSVNYRSVTLFGVPELITDKDEKMRQFELFLDKVSPNRWQNLRPVTDQEVKATGLVRIKIEEASIKLRNEPPIDDEEDYSWPVWAGVLPLDRQWGKPQQDPKQQQDYPVAQPPRAY
ncbi:pyridoxamine 5'-phosphate oxidase family protein [Marinomonas epiphytica]